MTSEKIRSAVEMLLTAAPRSEMDCVDGLDFLDLYKATEAVSSLLNRLCRRMSSETLLWDTDGVRNHQGTNVVQFDTLAIEVARFTDLWEDVSMESPKPSEKAYKLAEWVRRASERQPRLLRHFQSERRDSGIELRALPVKHWEHDLFQRWQRI